MEMPTVLEAAELVRSKSVSATELVELCLGAIEAGNPALNAFVHLDPEAALRTASEIDRTPPDERGPLAGVPFGVKDLEDCAGMPTTHGSGWFQGQPPVEEDSIHVARLRAAGAIPLGKTATPEFGEWGYTASPALGVTRNPWNTERTPGGSSGGSAAAVSAAMVPFCTASDGGGSIRCPAGFTGLVGLKCTYGRIPTLGVTHVAQNAVVGSLTTTVADHAALLDVMAGPDRRDRTCLPEPTVSYRDASEQLDTTRLRAAWSSDLGFAIVDPEVAAIAERAAQAVIDAARLRATNREVRFADYIPVYAKVEGVDKFIGVPEDLWRDRLDDLDPLVAPGWASAARATLPRIAAVYDARHHIEQEVAELFGDVDVLFTPMAAVPAFAAEGPMPTEVCGQPTHAGMAVPFAMLANITNLPAICVPAGVTQGGLPVGLQIVADRFREDVCLRLARLLELADPWPRFAPIAR